MHIQIGVRKNSPYFRFSHTLPQLVRSVENTQKENSLLDGKLVTRISSNLRTTTFVLASNNTLPHVLGWDSQGTKSGYNGRKQTIKTFIHFQSKYANFLTISRDTRNSLMTDY